MKGSTDLFQLVKSLDKNEKRYFKLFTSMQKGEKNHLKLFNVLDRQQEYDEHNIRKELVHENFIKHFPQEKERLYRLILKCLTLYNSKADNYAELKNSLHQIKILYDKGLYKQCGKIISKTKRLAEKYENYLVLLELSEREMQLIKIKSFHGTTEEDMGKFYGKVFKLTGQYINIKEHEKLETKTFIRIYQVGYTRSSADTKEYDDIIKHPLLSGSLNIEKTPVSYYARSHYYNVFCAYFFQQNDFINAYSYIKKLVQLMDEHPHQIKERLQDYLTVLNNLAICELNLKKYRGMTLTLKKLRDINTRSQHLKSRIFYIVNNLELNMYIHMGKFTQGIKLIAHVQKELSRVSLSKNTEMLLHYNIFHIYFGIRNYREARNYLNKIINDTTTDVRSDIYCLARIMLLVVHYELGHEELLEYMEKSAHRYLDKKERLYKVETAILDFMRKKVPEIIAAQDKIKAFKGLKSELGKITKDPFEKKALEYFDFISWLESKIENRPFAEIVKEKAKITQSQLSH